MYYQQQQQPGVMTPNAIVQEIGQLQQQLLYTNGNVQMQQQINNRINELNGYLRQIQNQNQVPQFQQNQMQQPQYNPQQAYPQMQQPSFQQQSYQQPFRQGYGTPVNDSTNTTITENSRYANRNTSRLEKYSVPNQNQAPEPQQPIVEKPKIPLAGNEFPFLLANGLTAAIKQMGDYFEYEVKGTAEDVYSTNLAVVTDESETPELASTDEYGTIRYHCLKNNTTNGLSSTLEYVNVSERKSFDPESFAKEFNEAKSLEEVSRLLRQNKDSRIVNIINKRLTNLVNENLHFNAIVTMSMFVDNFKEDINELNEVVIPEIQEVETRKRCMKAVSRSEAVVKSWQLTYEVDDNFVVWELTIPKNILYTSNKYYVEDIRDNLTLNTIVYVTPTSHEELFNLLEQAYDAVGQLGDVILSHITEDGSVVEYRTSRTYKNIFTVRKETK